MNDQLNQLLNSLSDLLTAIGATGQPTLAIAVNVVILGLIAMFVVWRIKSELRGIKWNNLTFHQRREMIQMILQEAIETAEWLHSNLEGLSGDAKVHVAKQKRKKALDYARSELRALGAAQQDLQTLDLRLEKVMAEKNPYKIRYGPTMTGPTIGRTSSSA